MADAPAQRWTWCQLGAREGYRLPAALAARDALERLVTDYWSGGSRWPPGLAHRWSEGVPEERVTAFNSAFLATEASRRLEPGGWSRVEERNRWFAHRAAGALPSGRGPVFAYAYAALEIAERCRAEGRPFVLGQIDGGPEEARIVAEEAARHPELDAGTELPPEGYWAAWRQETALADRIVVNSAWSRGLLEGAGVDADRLVEVPPAFAPRGTPGPRDLPRAFDRDRPLRVLFLGQVVLRKGVARLFEAIRLLRGAPVVFDIVGPVEVRIPADLYEAEAVHIHGPARGAAVSRYYEQADVFLFPTLSDGFGLVQLEALAHGLPVIASRCCGEVVRDGVDGIRLAEPSAEAIAGALTGLLDAPPRLAALAAEAGRGLECLGPEQVAGTFLDRCA